MNRDPLRRGRVMMYRLLSYFLTLVAIIHLIRGNDDQADTTLIFAWLSLIYARVLEIRDRNEWQ